MTFAAECLAIAAVYVALLLVALGFFVICACVDALVQCWKDRNR